MRKRTRAAVVLVCAAVLAGCTVEARDSGASATTSPDAAPPVTGVEPVPAEEIGFFSGIGALGAAPDCTATLIDAGADDGPAYLLTAGRCVGGMGRSPQSTTIGADGVGATEFLRLEGSPAATVDVDVAEIAYSTMRHVDLAIVRLDAAVGELESLGLRALPIADRQPTAADDVVFAGIAPAEPGSDAGALHRDDCRLRTRHTVIESSWIWFDVWSVDCAHIEEGFTGSPLLSVDSQGRPREIVGIGNTTAVGVVPADGGACALGRPCELGDDGGVRMEPVTFAQSVAGLNRCFAPSTGAFSPDPPCPLPMSDVWAEEGGGVFRGGDTTDARGRSPDVSLVGESVSVVRTTLVPIGDGTACLDKSTYAESAARLLPQAGEQWELVGAIVPVDLPESEGFHLLCAVRAEGYDRAASVLFQVDRSPPVMAADAVVERLDDGGLVVRPLLAPPEIAAVRFGWGTSGAIDCADAEQLDDYFLAPLVIGVDELPAVYCIYGMDAAGNRTPVSRIDLPAP